MNASDSRLLRRLKRGDRDALEALYREHAERVWRFVRLRCRSRETACDIVQETFVRVMKSVGTFQGRSSLGTWLFAIARNVAVDMSRRQRRRQSEQSEPAILRLVPAEWVSDPVERAEQSDAVRNAVARLRPAQRDAIVLCELCDMSIRDAATALEWSESRMKTTLHRARNKLREALVAEWSDKAQQSGSAG